MNYGPSADAVLRPGNASPGGMNGSTRPRAAVAPAGLRTGPAGPFARTGSPGPAMAGPAAVDPRMAAAQMADPRMVDPRAAATMAAIAQAVAARGAANGGVPPGAAGRPRNAAPVNRADYGPVGAEEDAGFDPDATIEIEYDGRTYEVPAALRGAFLRQQDYTRKTQGLARQRRALEQARTSLSMQLMSQQEHIRDVAALVNLDEQLQAFAGTNWQAVQQQNPQQANAAFQRMLALTDARNRVAASLQQKLRARAALAQQFGAQKAAAMDGELRRDIKGWDQTMAKRLRDYGVSLGFEPDELDAVSDPRLIKALHRAFTADQQRSGGQGPQQAQTQQSGLRPLTQVARRSSPAEIALSDRMSTDDWIKARNAQIKQRKGKH